MAENNQADLEERLSSGDHVNTTKGYYMYIAWKMVDYFLVPGSVFRAMADAEKQEEREGKETYSGSLEG